MIQLKGMIRCLLQHRACELLLTLLVLHSARGLLSEMFTQFMNFLTIKNCKTLTKFVCLQCTMSHSLSRTLSVVNESQ